MPTYDYTGTNGNNYYEMANIFPFDKPIYMRGLGGNDELKGAFLHDNFIWGGDGNDTLMGGAESNTLYGGAGNDRLICWIAGGFNELSGGRGRDYLEGGDGGNILNGGRGLDILIGGAGGDTYIVDRAGDKVVEDYVPGPGSGPNPVDLVISSVSWSLGARIENLKLSGKEGISGIGNVADNVLDGNVGNNVLIGAKGRDTVNGDKGRDLLFGGRGMDTIDGGQGYDKIKGGKGKDQLTGGIGADTFIFRKGDGSDTITDFEVGIDRIGIGKGVNSLDQLTFVQTDENVMVLFRDVEILVRNVDAGLLQDDVFLIG